MYIELGGLQISDRGKKVDGKMTSGLKVPDLVSEKSKPGLSTGFFGGLGLQLQDCFILILFFNSKISPNSRVTFTF